MPKIPHALHGLAEAAALMIRVARLPTPPPLTLAQRLENLPRSGAPVRQPVSIRWDRHALPIISAATMPDLAVGLGVVHAHLRLGQMEIMRRLAMGRIAEMIGPLGIKYDIALRCLDLARAAPAMIDMLPDDSRTWAEGFLAGVNHVITSAAQPPLDATILGIERTPWTLTDLMVLGRLASVDITWAPALKLLKLREAMAPAAWRTLWPELLGGGLPTPEGAPGALARGSNSMAAGGARTAGPAIIASDPHVGLQLPSIWLAASLHAPGFRASGLMIPGLPTVAIGRNADIAWGATNLHAGSSVFVDLTAEPNPEFRPREVEIPVRGGKPHRAVLRDSRFGPVISDCRLFGLKRPTALSWVGHRPSDELTAMLAVSRAQNFEEFRAALTGFAVQGYSFTYADRHGQVGIVRAAHVPARAAPPDDLLEPAAVMEHIVTLADSPAPTPPPEIVISANEDPSGDLRAGFFYSPPDRAARLAGLLAPPRLTLDDLKSFQKDVLAPACLAGRGRLAERAAAMGVTLPSAFLNWDGHYTLSSAGALAYELVAGETARRVIGKAALEPFLAGWTGRSQIMRRLLAADNATLRPALAAAAARATKTLRRTPNWGAAHQLRLAHPLARLPFAGRVFRGLTFGVPGSNDTVYKMGHRPLRAARAGVHAVTYGVSARHAADMANAWHDVVILGGQDGWIGALNATDQVEIFRQGAMLRLPLSAADAGETFPWETILKKS